VQELSAERFVGSWQSRKLVIYNLGKYKLVCLSRFIFLRISVQQDTFLLTLMPLARPGKGFYTILSKKTACCRYFS